MKLKLIGAFIGIALGVFIAQISPPPGLNVKAMWGMGVFVCAVAWWIANCLPDFVTALLMCAAWAGLKVVPFGTAFSGFAGFEKAAVRA